MEYKIIYSDRKTLAISIIDGFPVVRAPRNMDSKTIEQIVLKHKKWIDSHVVSQKIKREMLHSLDESDIKAMKKTAKEYFEDKTAYYADIMGLTYNKITITSAKGRFGSCNTKGGICFSYRLMLYPEAAREYVVVHELAHLKEMNHSSKFYKIIERVMPDYKERKRMLK